MTTPNQILIDVPPARYDGISRFLHWLTLTLLIAQFGLGWLMPDADSVKSPEGLVAWHVGVGTSLLVVILIRFVWAVVRRNPSDVGQSGLLRIAARAVHISLYALLVGVPVLGAQCKRPRMVSPGRWCLASTRDSNARFPGCFDWRVAWYECCRSADTDWVAYCWRAHASVVVKGPNSQTDVVIR